MPPELPCYRNTIELFIVIPPLRTFQPASFLASPTFHFLLISSHDRDGAGRPKTNNADSVFDDCGGIKYSMMPGDRKSVV